MRTETPTRIRARSEYLIPGCPPEALSHRRLSRIHACGTEGTGILRDGATLDLAFRCGDRWCRHCGRAYEQRTYAAVLARLREAWPGDAEPTLYMLTLTRPTHWRIGRDEAGRARRALAAQWSRAVSILQRCDLRVKRARRDSTVRDARHELATFARGARGIRRRMATTFDPAESRWDAEGNRTWIRVWEWGSGGEYHHPHLHVLCPSLAVAERLNAAWQLARTGRDYCQTRISNRDPVNDQPYTLESAARYLAGYSTKGTGLDKLDSTPHTTLADGRTKRHAYRWEAVRAMRGARRFQGSGRWRSLGLRREPSGRLESVEADGYTFTPAEWARDGAVSVSLRERLRHPVGSSEAGWTPAPPSGERSAQRAAGTAAAHLGGGRPSAPHRVYRLDRAPTARRRRADVPRREYVLRASTPAGGAAVGGVLEPVSNNSDSRDGPPRTVDDGARRR